MSDPKTYGSAVAVPDGTIEIDADTRQLLLQHWAMTKVALFEQDVDLGYPRLEIFDSTYHGARWSAEGYPLRPGQGARLRDVELAAALRERAEHL